MKLESKYFDRLRVKPDQDRLLRDSNPACAWPGCANPGLHRAPRGRGREKEYFLFCLDHVRQYNKSYNYFEGMSDNELRAFQKSAETGHRPTWTVGAKGAHDKNVKEGGKAGSSNAWRVNDPFGLFRFSQPDAPADADGAARRPVRTLERRALRVLNLRDEAGGGEIKTRYKLLVKRHHPDANGGSREAEEKLREIIQAYTYLKSVGFC